MSEPLSASTNRVCSDSRTLRRNVSSSRMTTKPRPPQMISVEMTTFTTTSAS
jgi:hypothetical protein